MKNKVKFADDAALVVDGISGVSIKRMSGKHSLIKDVLYISRIKYNIFSIGRLLEKGYKIHIENKALRVMDTNRVLVLKALIAPNRTSRVELKVMKHMCIVIAAS